VVGCLKTTGALDIEAPDAFDGSSRFAYRDKPPLEGVEAEGFDIVNCRTAYS
jgi:hypothetical protein